MAFDKKNKNKIKKAKNRKTKKILVFDDTARTEFLTGFKKRKDERKRRGMEQAERMIKEERKRLKQKRKEFLDKKVKHQSLPPDLEELMRQEVTELPDHTVTVTDISEVDLAGQGGLRLGFNKFTEDDDDDNDIEAEDASGDEKGEDAEEGHHKKAPEGSGTVKKKQKILKNMDKKIQKKEKLLKIKKSSKRKPKRLLSKKKKHKQKRDLFGK